MVREAAGAGQEVEKEWQGGEGANRGTGAPTQAVNTDCLHSCNCNNKVLWFIEKVLIYLHCMSDLISHLSKLYLAAKKAFVANALFQPLSVLRKKVFWLSNSCL